MLFIIRKTIVLSVLSAVAAFTSAKGQNMYNYISLNQTSSLNYTCSTAYSLENSQTLSNALDLVLRTTSSNCSVYARISSFSAPTGYTVSSPYPVQLDFNSTNSGSYSNLITAPVTLTSSNQRLFTHTKKSNIYHFYYNLILLPLGYTYPPGNYSFTILFTMTQP